METKGLSMFLEMSLNLYFRTVIILVINPAGFITTVLSDICLIKRQKIHFLKENLSGKHSKFFLNSTWVKVWCSTP